MPELALLADGVGVEDAEDGEVVALAGAVVAVDEVLPPALDFDALEVVEAPVAEALGEALLSSHAESAHN